MATTLSTALLLREAGVSTIPVKPDKRPTIEWRKYMTDTPTEAELSKFFANGAGIALVAGKVQCLDFDEKYSAGIFARFVKRSEEVGLDFLIGELIRQKTPSGGYHLVWRCDGRPIRNLKLAEKPNHECMIETRGEGGYFLIAPSNGYTIEHGDWSSIPTISEEDRDALLSLARSFDERPPIESPKADQSLGHDVTPGDDYDFRADIPALLRSHGWKSSGGSEKYWTRPGKNRGISASWDVVPGRLFVFSSSTAFEPNHVYRPWHIYAVLECGSDFRRAATELRRQGFGSAPKKKTSVSDWLGDEPPGVEPSPDDPPAVEGVDPMGEAPTTDTEEDKIRRLLRARAFDDACEPPPLVPLFTLAGIVICTPGNLTSITAQAKVGKSSFVAAMMAAAMAAPDTETDLLSVTGFNQHGKAMVYFDTEQSPYHFWHAVSRAKRRARVSAKPEWLSAFRIADLPAQVSRKAVAIHMADVAEAYGGIHAVVIDGVADLVADVNDAEECNSLVAELHTLAIRYDCSIICVIHKNPGGDKVRGHLGSQLERKAETNLSLDKEEGVTVVWSAKQRGASIDKKDAPRFAWDDELKMHASVQPENRPTSKLVEMLELAESVMRPGESVTWKDLLSRLTEARTPAGGRPPVQSTVERWIAAMKKAEVLTVSFGSYRLNPKTYLNPQPSTNPQSTRIEG
jgi:hypothetical protein